MLRLLALLLLVLAVPAAAQATFASERIGVTVTGSGPDVILIPGLSSHPDVWRATTAAVPGYRYHLIHVSGFAGRPARANASGPVLEPVAEEIARYIGESRLARPAIVGHSLGGTWGMMIAARHPELVGKLMALDSVPYLGTIFAPPGSGPERVREIAERFRTGIAGAPADMRRGAAEQMAASMVRAESERPAVVRWSLDSDRAVVGQAMYDGIITDLTPLLPGIRAPFTVLYVLPAGAPLTPEQIDQFYRTAYAGVPGATLRRIPDSAHFIMLDQPAVFQAALREFLAR